ncbi:hypothetical protein NQ318_018751 [Aromia moschata]|uniref:Uncharacterized protein n=1 Tax=Aromia moschata TaxID=1265417 RepID=A0AAV8ZG50_9CUCU|nr:hypothetical protein NQ318_018751 [Aromia moschata]
MTDYESSPALQHTFRTIVITYILKPLHHNLKSSGVRSEERAGQINGFVYQGTDSGIMRGSPILLEINSIQFCNRY